MPTTRSSQKNNAKQTIDFEASLKQLTGLVEKMESGNLSLEDSLALFEEGVTLIKNCQEALTLAEQKITTITDKTNHHD